MIVTVTSMQIETIRNVADWAALAGQWNALLRESHSHVPFLTYEFQSAWWQELGGGEWQDAELNILLSRDGDGGLIGIAPLFLTTDQDGGRVLHFIGSHEIADFLDLIVRPQDHTAFAQAIVEHLSGTDAPNWERLELYNLLGSSLTPALLRAAAEKESLAFSHETLQPSPYIVIPATLDAYIDSLGSKQAHELRRKLRRAARNPDPISLEIVQDAAELETALDEFIRLMTRETQKAAFLTPAMRKQMETIARTAFAGGWLQLVFLKSGDARIAGYMNFDYDNCIWAYNAGFDAAFAALSPGWLIMAKMIAWCIENDRHIFDFMRGGEDYKYRFGGVDRFVQKVTISRTTNS
ncbi:MAG: GNAT family N-acetyltransferase [Anaerolineales bacterium]